MVSSRQFNKWDFVAEFTYKAAYPRKATVAVSQNLVDCTLCKFRDEMAPRVEEYLGNGERPSILLYNSLCFDATRCLKHPTGRFIVDTDRTLQGNVLPYAADLDFRTRIGFLACRRIAPGEVVWCSEVKLAN